MKKILRKFIAVLLYLIYICIAASIPASIIYLLLSDDPRIKLTVISIIVAVTFLFFFIEDIRLAGGPKKHFKNFIL